MAIQPCFDTLANTFSTINCKFLTNTSTSLETKFNALKKNNQVLTFIFPALFYF